MQDKRSPSGLIRSAAYSSQTSAVARPEPLKLLYRQRIDDYRSMTNLLTKKAEPPNNATVTVTLINATEVLIGAFLKFINSSLYSAKKSFLYLFRSHIQKIFTKTRQIIIPKERSNEDIDLSPSMTCLKAIGVNFIGSVILYQAHETKGVQKPTKVARFTIELNRSWFSLLLDN